MAKVNSASVSSAINLCTQATEALNATSKMLISKYEQAGSTWKDEKYKQLGSILSNCTQELQSPVEGLAACKETLAQILEAINEYENVRI